MLQTSIQISQFYLKEKKEVKCKIPKMLVLNIHQSLLIRQWPHLVF